MIVATRPSRAPVLTDRPAEHPTVWGLSPVQLHDHFWAARGVCVARMGEERTLPEDAELYLLTDARTLSIFRLSPLLDTLSWVRPKVMFLRVVSKRDYGYRENVVTTDDGKFVRFQRLYGGALPRLSRVALTRDVRTAYAWQRAGDSRTAWKQLRRESRRARADVATITGRVYDRTVDQEVARFVYDLTQFWKQPSTTVAGVRTLSPQVWAHEEVKLGSDIRFVGPAWIGAGRTIEDGATVLGPTVLWDDPSHRPRQTDVRFSELEPAQVLAYVRRNADLPGATSMPRGKRLFDIVFALVVLILTAPLYVMVMLAIWFEDGRPFFFAHKRETLGGREFGCIKFRSMRKDAEQVKAKLAAANQADGPQFFIADDPRLTRVGRFIRKTNIDELPQFINVLLGDMSVVGPRPSPRAENQFSPAWRETRLSTRAGVTGLWQVSRTRRPGLDFQEWIKFDVEYVQKASWRMDLNIILRTLGVLLRGVLR